MHSQQDAVPIGMALISFTSQVGRAEARVIHQLREADFVPAREHCP
jgi:hypothetical protein